MRHERSLWQSLGRLLGAESDLRGRQAARVRWLAHGLLVGMAGLYLLSRHLMPAHPGWEWVKSFAEAAMVGALADWFAVTALFRHPMGLPIPHTAIIPAKKDQIADSMAGFLRANFLTPQVVARRLSGLDVAGALGGFLTDLAKGPERANRACVRGRRACWAICCNRCRVSNWAICSNPPCAGNWTGSIWRLCWANCWKGRWPMAAIAA